jgi:hypothetical protein
VWKTAGDEIILFMDVNDHAYNGRIPRRLGEHDLMMTERFAVANGFEAPNTYYRGSRPITGCYCTQGIDCINVFVSPPCAGAGGHRYWIMDFDAKSVLGAGYPHLVRPKGRRLKTVVKRTRVAYIKHLHKLTERHKMYSKMKSLQDGVGTLSDRKLKICMNKWDRENVEHKLGSEEACNQYKNDYIKFSPETNVWIKRRDLYTQLHSINVRRDQGKRADITHFVRACAASDILDPFLLSDRDIGLRIKACNRLGSLSLSLLLHCSGLSIFETVSRGHGNVATRRLSSEYCKSSETRSSVSAGVALNEQQRHVEVVHLPAFVFRQILETNSLTHRRKLRSKLDAVLPLGLS